MRIKVLAVMATAGLVCMGSNADFSDFSDPSAWAIVYSDDPDNGGSFESGYIPEINTTDDRTFILRPDTSWYDQAAGNKWLESSVFFEGNLIGEETQASFTFTVDANDLDPSYEVRGFVQVLDAFASWQPHGTVDEVVIANGVSGGTFTLSIPMDPTMGGMILQAGFVMEGFNANPADDWGSVTVTATALTIPEPSSIAMIGLVSGGALFIRRRFMI